MKPNLLITGASGFIGSHLIEEAVAQGYNVFAAVRKTSNIIFPPNGLINVIQLDYNHSDKLVSQLTELRNKYGRFDYIIHNAGITRATAINDFDEVNNLLAQRFIKAIEKAGNIPTKFLLVSSMAAFGPGDKYTMMPITLDQPMNPITNYAESKKAIANYFLNQTIVQCIIVYPTAVYGPRDKDFIAFIKLIDKGIEPYLGLYKQLLSIVHVQDLAFAIVGLLQKGDVGSQYIISDNKYYDKKELGTIVKGILNKKTLKLSIPVTPVFWVVELMELIFKIFAPNKLPLLKREKIHEISCPNWSCDSKDVWNVLGQEPKYDLQSGMQQTIQWYKDNGMI